MSAEAILRLMYNNKDNTYLNIYHVHGRIQRGEPGVRPAPLKNHKNIGFLGNTGPDPMENHKASKPALYVGPPSARQRNAILMAFRWWTDDGPF